MRAWLGHSAAITVLLFASCSAPAPDTQNSAAEVGQTAQTVVGTQGGQITTPAGTASVNVPSGALPGDVTLTVAVQSPNSVAAPPVEQQPSLVVTSNLYDFGPSGTQFSTPVTVTVTATSAAPAGSQNYLAYLDANNVWQVILGATDANGVFSGAVNHFTLFGIVSLPTNGSGCASQLQPNAFCAPSVCDMQQNMCAAAGVADPNHSSLAISPNTLVADGSTSATITATLADTAGNPVANASVTFTASGANNLFSSAVATTNANGQATATLASTMAEEKTITAVGAGVTLSGSVVFAAGTPISTASSLMASPNTVAADGNQVITLTATYRDAFGNPISGLAVAFSVSGTNNVLNPASAVTDAAGIAAATLVSTTAQSETVTASAGSLVVTTNVTFTSSGGGGGGAPSASTSSFAASPNALAADGNSAATLIVTVRDASSNPVASASVTFAATGSNNTFSSTVATTNSLGVATSSLASTTAEQKTVTATTGAITLTTSVMFTQGGPSASTSSLVASPNSVAADGNHFITLTATYKDASGNPIPNLAVSLSANGINNVFSPASGTTNGSGAFTATLASATAQTEVVTATAGSVALTTSVTFGSGGGGGGAPSASTSSLVASPNALVADGNATTLLIVTVEDASSNPVDGASVTFSVTGSNNMLSSTVATTSSGGIAMVSLASTTAEEKTATAMTGGITLTTSVTFVQGAPSASTSSLVASPNSVPADGNHVITLTATYEDAAGNPIANLSVAFSTTGTNNVLNPPNAVTDASGVATATLVSTTAQSEVVTAAAGGLALTTSVTFGSGTVGANASTSSLVASPNVVAADGNSFTTLTVTVRDASSNPLAGADVTFGATGANNILSPTVAITDGGGVATAILASTTAEQKTMTAATGGITLTTDVTFVAGVPSASMSSLVASPNNVAADGNQVITLTATYQDASGNPISGLAVSFSTTGTNNVLNPASTTTNATGVATVTLVSTTAQSEVVTATAGSLSLTTNVTFGSGGAGASASTSSLVASPNTLAGDGNSFTTLTVTVEDASSNPLAGASVTFSATGTSNMFSATVATTNGVGVATVTLASTVAEQKTVTAMTGGIALTTSVTFVAGVPSATTSTLVASPNSVAGDGNHAITLTATYRDASGNPISGLTVLFGASGTNNVLNPASATTSAVGVATAALLSTTAQSETATASSGGITLTTSVTFTSGSSGPNASTSSLVASPNTLVADGNTVTTLMVTVQDASSNPVSGASVTFSASGSSNNFSATVATTNGVGGAIVTLGSTMAQLETVTASTGGISLTTNVLFVAGPPSSSTSSLVASPNNVVADGNSLIALTATYHDASGNPISGLAVTFSASGTSNTLSPAQGTTNALGVARASLASTAAQTETVTASAGSVTVTTSVTFSLSFMDDGVSVADLNNDGFPDLLTAAVDGRSVTSQLGDGQGGFRVVGDFAVDSKPTFIKTADLNGDGKQDIVVGGDAEHDMEMLLGNGDGTFQESVQLTLGRNARDVAMADLNGDGRLDLVLANAADATIGIAFGAANGVFSEVTSISLNHRPEAVAVAFVHDGGAPDIVALAGGRQGVGYLTVLTNDGEGTFGAPAIYSATQVGSVSMHLADYNHDGIIDVATGGDAGSIALGDGFGHFIVGETFPAGGPVGGGDFNGDGYQDILIGLSRPGQGQGEVAIYLGNGDGTVGKVLTTSAGADVLKVRVADFNVDGHPDVAGVSREGSVDMLLGFGDGTFVR